MQRYLIKEVKVNEGEQLLTCTPPATHSTVASIRYETEGRIGWLHCIETLGYHTFFYSDEDLHDRFVKEADGDEDFLASKCIEEFDGMDLYMAAADEVSFEEATQYEKDFEHWAQKHNEFMSAYSAYPLVRYALALSQMWKPEDVQIGISEGLGKYADEIDFSGNLKRFERLGE